MRHGLRLRIMLLAADVVAAAAAVAAAALIAGVGIRPAALLAGPFMLAIASISGLHTRDELVLRRTTLDEIPQIVRTAFALVVWAWLLAPPMLDGPVGRPGGYGFLLGAIGGMAGMRGFARLVWARTSPPERCLLLVSADNVDWLRGKVDDYAVNVEVVGHLDARTVLAGGSDGFRTLEQTVSDLGVHRLLIMCGADGTTPALDLLRAAKGVGVRISLVPDVLEVLGSSVLIEDLGGVPVVGVRSLGLSRLNRGLKRVFDVVVASVCLLFAGPVLAVLALLIKLDSRGPVLFRQIRVGRDGRHFEILKLRSMVDGADAGKHLLMSGNETAGVFKLTDDPRVTRVGRFIRATSLDELPQLVNVLRSEMSLVGPRPLILDEDVRVTGYDRRRLKLKPGMTGPWQILLSARVPLNEMVRIDYRYVATWSLWGDLKIILRTAVFVVARRGV